MMLMSLVMLYNGHIACDKKGCLDDESFLNYPVKKMFVSDDKVFCIAYAGELLDEEHCKFIHQQFILEHLKKIDKEKLHTNIMEKIFFGDCNGIIVFNRQIYLYNINTKQKEIKIFLHNEKQNYFFGNGKTAAKVLDNSGKKIPLEKFFKIVSYSDVTTSAEYDFIKLNDLRKIPK